MSLATTRYTFMMAYVYILKVILLYFVYLYIMWDENKSVEWIFWPILIICIRYRSITLRENNANSRRFSYANSNNEYILKSISVERTVLLNFFTPENLQHNLKMNSNLTKASKSHFKSALACIYIQGKADLSKHWLIRRCSYCHLQ